MSVRQRKKIQEVLRRLSRFTVPLHSPPRRAGSIVGLRLTAAACLFGAAIFFAGGCATHRTLPPLPSPEPSERFSESVAGFRIDVHERSIHYTLALELEEPLDEPLFIEAIFENPADPQEPLVERFAFEEGTSTIYLESPPVSGLAPEQSYAIELLLYDAPDADSMVDRHLDYVFSNIETHDR